MPSYAIVSFDMKAKTTEQRLSASEHLQSLPRISRPPKKLALVLNLVNLRKPKVIPALTASLDQLEKRLRLVDLLPTGVVAENQVREWCDMVISMWRENLTKIARGEHQGSMEILYRIDSTTGEFRLDRDPLIEGLNACGKNQLLHLRVCAVCGRLFWAKKLQRSQLNDPQAKVGCSDRCKNILRVRKSRFVTPRPKKAKQPGKEIIECVRRSVRGWQKLYKREFDPKRDIRDLAEGEGITVKQAECVLDYLAKEKRANTARQR